MDECEWCDQPAVVNGMCRSCWEDGLEEAGAASADPDDAYRDLVDGGWEIADEGEYEGLGVW